MKDKYKNVIKSMANYFLNYISLCFLWSNLQNTCLHGLKNAEDMQYSQRQNISNMFFLDGAI